MKMRTLIIMLGIVAVIGAAAYWRTTAGEYIYDDKPFILDVEAFHHAPSWDTLLTRGYFDAFKERTYRPVLSLSFFVDAYVWNLKPSGAHAFNIALHIITSFLVFGILFLLLRHPHAALFGAVLFAAHPVHVEAVALSSNREELLCALFFFNTFFLYLLWRVRHRHIASFLILATISFVFAMFSKEMAASLPSVLLLHDILRRGPGENFWSALRKSAPFTIACAAVVVLFLILRYTLFRNSVGEAGWLGGSAWRTLLTMPGVFFIYLRLLVFPHPLCAEYPLGIAKVLTITNVSAALGMILFLIVAVRAARRRPFLAYAMLFFTVTWLPVSNIIPFGEIMSERYAYIPSFAIVLLASWLFANSRAFNSAKITAAALIVLIFIGLTASRGGVWKTEYSLWNNSAACAPLSCRAHLNLGNALAMRGENSKAIAEYDKALACPRLVQPFDIEYNRGLALMALGRMDEAEADFIKSLHYYPEYVLPHYSLGEIAERRGDFSKALAYYRKAIEIDPENGRSYYIASRFLLAHGKSHQDLRQAFQWIQHSVALDPRNAHAHALLGYVLLKFNHRSGAIDELRIAVGLDPDNPSAKALLEELKVPKTLPPSPAVLPVEYFPWKARLVIGFLGFTLILGVMYVYYLALE